MINTLIKSCRFSTSDIIAATEGECMSFALALHIVLKNMHINSKMVAVEHSREPINWLHVLVEFDRELYDIRGKVKLRSVHREFGTDILRDIFENEIREDIKRFISEGIHPYIGKNIDSITPKWCEKIKKGIK